MTNTGDYLTEDQRARLIAEARRRSSRLTKAAVVLLVVTVPVAFVVGLLIADRERGAGGLLIRLLLLLVPAAVGVAIALLVNAWMTRNPSMSGGTDPTSLRRVKAALRHGRTTDPRVDALARKEAEQQIRRRWLPWAIGVALVMQVLLAIGTDRTSTRWTSGLGAVAWAALLCQHWRTTQRARRYLTGPTFGQAER
ncbi:hypothetical protein ACGFIW_00485 [Micromonospora sp. NPDC048935]|uniref:hypothetical protein n=1 Tax=Micromonospora sp. NPDC048935 TaxID=3364262 RepID=UPI0037192609